MTEDSDPGHGYLRKARFFLDRVCETERAESLDQFGAGAYLEASIVFAKGAQDWMADTRGGREEPLRKAWLKSSPLWNDPLCKYFANVRDLVVHEDGSVNVMFKASVMSYELASISVSESSLVTSTLASPNPSPWDRIQRRRQAQVAAKSAKRARKVEEARLRRIIAQHREETERRAKELADRPGHVTRLYFQSDVELIGGRPAVDAVGDYIARLERVLTSG